jgi:acyl carrier protein
LRIELGEIESVINQQDGVLQSVVVARRVMTAAGDAQLCAYVVAQDYRLDTKAIGHALRQTLPDYMVPQYIVVLSALPLNANGKVDRKALPDPMPNVSVATSAPVSELERWLVAQTAELTGRQLEVDQNLFDGGATSLTAAQLVGRIRSRFGRDVPLVKVFEYPTLGSLAAYLSECQGGKLSADPTVGDARSRAGRRRQVIQRRERERE